MPRLNIPINLYKYERTADANTAYKYIYTVFIRKF